MNLREQKLFAKSQVGDQQLIDAHFVRWINLAYREIARQVIIPRLNNGNQVTLVVVPGSTQRFFLPYDFSKVISFQDQNFRSLDPILSEDVRQFGEYNSFGTFAQFFEHNGVNQTPLLDSGSTPDTIGIPNRSTTVTASSAIFTDAHVGEWLLPTARNTTTGAGNPEDYAYQILSTSGTVAVPALTCTISVPFRGVLSDGGSSGDLTTSYFEIRPRNTPIIRIWGDPGSTTGVAIKVEYQRVPLKLANDEDIPEEPRLAEAIVHKAMQMAGIAYRQGFMVQAAKDMVMNSLSSFQTVKDFDKQLIHNFLTANPNSRGYSQISGRHLGGNLSQFSWAPGTINY
jgi:hypothetical protein